MTPQHIGSSHAKSTDGPILNHRIEALYQESQQRESETSEGLLMSIQHSNDRQ